MLRKRENFGTDSLQVRVLGDHTFLRRISSSFQYMTMAVTADWQNICSIIYLLHGYHIDSLLLEAIGR